MGVIPMPVKHSYTQTNATTLTQPLSTASSTYDTARQS
jgi:hypothetical protein